MNAMFCETLMIGGNVLQMMYDPADNGREAGEFVLCNAARLPDHRTYGRDSPDKGLQAGLHLRHFCDNCLHFNDNWQRGVANCLRGSDHVLRRCLTY